MQANSSRLRHKHARLFLLVQALFISGIANQVLAENEELPTIEVKGEAVPDQ